MKDSPQAKVNLFRFKHDFAEHTLTQSWAGSTG